MKFWFDNYDRFIKLQFYEEFIVATSECVHCLAATQLHYYKQTLDSSNDTKTEYVFCLVTTQFHSYKQTY